MIINSIHRIAIGLAAAGVAAAAWAAYPDKPVQYVIPFAPGGESDIAARFQAQAFKEKYKQDMIVVNKAGAGGGLAWSQMNSMPGDGYTIVGVALASTIVMLVRLQTASAPERCAQRSLLLGRPHLFPARREPVEQTSRPRDDALRNVSTHDG